MRVIEDIGINGLKIIQDDGLYRFTSDSVLLTRFASIKRGEVLADFCSGSGIVGIHAYALNPEIKSVDLFEMQQELAEMSAESVVLNNLENMINVHNCRLQDIRQTFNGKYNEYFSMILCNPPYEKADSGVPIEKREIAVCKKELTLKLNELIQAASTCLKFGGRFALTHKADRLTDVLCEMRKCNIEPKRLQLVYGGKELYLIMVEGVKGGKSGLKIEPPIIN